MPTILQPNILLAVAGDVTQNFPHLQDREIERPEGVTLTMLILDYVPNAAGAGIMGVAFIALAAILFWHIYRYKTKWGLVLPIGAAFMGQGFFFRIALIKFQNSLSVYAQQQVSIVCAPAAFLAFNYILYGRFVTACVGPQNSFIHPAKIARVFIISDVLTFCLQGAGGSITIYDSIRSIGEKLLLVGLIAQLVSYALYTVLLVHTHWKTKHDRAFTGQEAWWKILWCLHVTSVLILIRCVYRAIEQAQGHGGYLLVHEVFFYVLDVVPLFFVVLIYTVYWPAQYMKAPSDVNYARASGSTQGMNDGIHLTQRSMV